MLVKSPKYRRALNTKQIELLKLLFKFRFITTDLVSELLGKDRSTIYESLYVLEKQDYVYKFYDKSYRFRQRPAIYTLNKGGIRYLMSRSELDQTTLRNFYKNRSLDDEQIDKYLNVFQITNTLKRQTGGKFSIHTKYELNRDAFIRPLPELYLARNGKSQKPDYILDIFPAFSPSWLLKKRLRQHQELSEEESDYFANYPSVLLVAQNPSTEKRLFRMLESAMQDFDFLITQQDLLLNSNDGKVWIDLYESDEEEFVRIGLWN